MLKIVASTISCNTGEEPAEDDPGHVGEQRRGPGRLAFVHGLGSGEAVGAAVAIGLFSLAREWIAFRFITANR